ncbi:MAG: type II toxin-antitoxin system HicA family toxin [bacterium]
MSKKDKILKKFLQKPNDFTYNELRTLLGQLGYKELSSGKTSGSRVAFINETSLHVIRLHKPHPKNILKNYQIEQIIEELQRIGVLNEG